MHRRYASPDETVADMAVEAAMKAMADAGIYTARRRPDALIVSEQVAQTSLATSSLRRMHQAPAAEGNQAQMNMTESQILRLVLDTVSDVVGLDPATLEPEARLIDEYGLDSLELMEIGTRLERALMVRIEPEGLFDAVCPADVAAYLYHQAVVA
jgi:acyl carrier protein